MNKRHGLGKGLGALIPEEEEQQIEAISKISIQLIKPNVEQPRKNFDDQKILQLVESIKEHGIIQPIVLKKDGEIYTIVAGERRWRAAKNAGLKEMPAVIMELSDKDVLEISLIENIQREDLNPIEEATAFKKLIGEFKLTQEEVASRIGKSRTAVTNCLRLLNLDERVQQYLVDGVISEGHGRALLGTENKDLQCELAEKIIDEGLSVREIEKAMKDFDEKANMRSNNRKIKENPYYVDIRDKLECYFGTKVFLSNNKNKGKIEIEYYSEEDLQRILDIIQI